MPNVVAFRSRMRYEPGKYCVFSRLINARCSASVGSLPWESRYFSGGECLMYVDRKDRRFFFFIGIPIGEKEEYYFILPAE